jgi:lycopene beta-cyclase
MRTTEAVRTFDAVIAGGGLSGLSLAAHLATGGWRDRSVLIVDDPRAHPVQRWAFWSAGPGLLDAAASRRYDRVRVSAGGIDRVVLLGRYRYTVVRRDDLRRAVTAILTGCPGFRCEAGHVEQIADGPGYAEVTADGLISRAAWAFDGLGRLGPDGYTTPEAHLAFTGWEVACDRPAFDPLTPVLFDFRTPQAGGARFVYVLPDDERHALVELVVFVPRHASNPSTSDLSVALDDYLCEVIRAGRYTIDRIESAVLPLRTRPPHRSSGRVLTIGARGGLIKASTGYAYQRIQEDGAAIAASLSRNSHPFIVRRSRRRFQLLDAIFLDALDQEPALLDQSFAAMFAHNPAERVLRFLDERSSVADELRLIATLPVRPFLRSAVRVALRRNG